MRRFALFLLLAALIAAAPAGATTKVGTSAAQFLKIGAGCRAAALGGAYVAIANDAAALYWNPAGLARLDHNELLLMHADWLAETNYNFGGVVMNFGGNALGVFLTYLLVGLGLYQVLQRLPFLTTLGKWVYGFTAALCLILAVLSIIDYLAARRGRPEEMRLRLPLRVLISPLCATSRIGWASRQFGNVFVLYR